MIEGPHSPRAWLVNIHKADPYLADGVANVDSRSHTEALTDFDHRIGFGGSDEYRMVYAWVLRQRRSCTGSCR